MTAATALQSPNDLDAIADELCACRGDPERFVDTMFDWNAGELKGKQPSLGKEMCCARSVMDFQIKQSDSLSHQVMAWARPLWFHGYASGRWQLVPTARAS
jgi:hypothetical protein